MDRYQLERFEIQDAGNNNVVILVTGTRLYKPILEHAFNNLYFSRTFDDRYERFEWGTYVYNVDKLVRENLTDFLHLLQESIYIHDDLTETFALDFHTKHAPGGYARTSMGSLVYAAKPYSRSTGSRDKADELADVLLAFIKRHPSYTEADVVMAVPPSNPDKQFDLPTHLVARIGDHLNKINATRWIKKVRDTQPMKNCETIQNKIDNVRGAYETAPSASFQGKSVLLIDDIYQSGFTLNEVGRTIATDGASAVLGLVATKTSQDIR